MNDYVGPMCHAHAAHEWGVPQVNGKCLRCPMPIVLGDLYLCDDGGVIHVTCPPSALWPGIRAVLADPSEDSSPCT